MGKTRGICRGVVWAMAITWLVGSSAGCTRMFYRKQADREVDAILREKDVFPAWKIENMQVYPDARARFADPTKPDRPPMPPDDPAAKMLGPNPQKAGHAGIDRVEGTGYLDLLANWDAQNRAEDAAVLPSPFGRGVGGEGNAPRMADTIRKVAYRQQEEQNPELLPPPRPLEALPEIKTHAYKLRIEQAMELGLINSREFQARREDLYLTALPVTRERFAFSAQWLAIGQAVREKTGASIPSDTGGNGWSFGSTVGFSKLFSTGALLLASFANQTALNFGNPALPRVTSTSTINLDLIQPLLRGGGKAVTLEPLTQAERNLLYDIRAYARFRKQYYQYLIGGGNLDNLPGSVLSAGSLASSHPLLGTAASGNAARQQVVPAGIGAVGGSATSGTLALGINPIAPSEGYLPSLYKASLLRYEESNVEALQKVVRMFVDYEKGGQVSTLQVEQAELQLLQGRSDLLAAKQIRDDSIDSFKAQLGIPIDIPLVLDEERVRPITDQLKRYDTILLDYKVTVDNFDRLYDLEKLDNLHEQLDAIVKESSLTKGAKHFSETFPNRWKQWRELKDIKAIDENLEKQRNKIRKLEAIKTDRELKDQTLTPEEQKELRLLEQDVVTGYLEKSVRKYKQAPWLKEIREHEKKRVKTEHWSAMRIPFVLVLEDANAERFESARPQWHTASPVVVDGVVLIKQSELKDVGLEVPEDVYERVAHVALENRLDLMNARAQLVDSWRQLRVFANGLLGVFNLAYHMDSSTPPGAGTPLAFQNSLTRHQLIMNFDLPLARVTERNGYRASLIAYQRSRRDLQQKEDEIVAQVRTDIRKLHVLEKNLTIQQKAVELAYRQVESAEQIFRAPQIPDNSPNAAANAAANAASLTNQLLNAYRGLPRAQEQVLKTWIDYQIARQQLFLDMELMPLDARGVWIDESADSSVERQCDRQPSQLERQPDGGASAVRTADYREARRGDRPTR